MSKRIGFAIASLAMLGILLVKAASPSTAQGVAGAASRNWIAAVTVPSDDRSMSFHRRGLIARIAVKDGDAVEPGQELIALDNRVEAAERDQLASQAHDTTRVKAAEATLQQKRVDLEKLQDAATKGAATGFEVMHAELDVTIAELTLQLQRVEQGQAGIKLRGAEAAVEQMTLRSPFRGRVELVSPHVGEAAEELKPVIRLVQTDPLWIDAPVPVSQAIGLCLGQTARVYGRDQKLVGEARIIYIFSVADATSEKLHVRLELANPSLQPAGQHVQVDFQGAPRTATQPSSLATQPSTGEPVARQPQ